MKVTLTNKDVVKITTLVIVMLLAIAGYSENVDYSGASGNTDTIFIQKTNVSKAHRISLYPDADQKVVFFSVRGSEGKVYQLYVFDIDGKVVRQAETRNRETTVLKNIEKGNYFFEVFSDDTRIGNGQIAVR